LASKLRLSGIAGDPAFEPYEAAAASFQRAHIAWLAAAVGGGYVGPGPASIVATAALQLAASRYAFDRGDYTLGSKLGNDSRQNLLAAHELVAREATARPDPAVAAMAQAKAEFQRKLLERQQ
jgi:hypothetical protein